MRASAVGLLVGLVGAMLAARLLRAFLYGVGPADPVAIVGAVVVLGAAALVASWLPARASARVDPMVSMRAE